MKVIALFSLTLFFTTLGIAQELHPWTDLQGRTLEASFMKSDGVTVTINWNEKVVPIPLASLSPKSQALAQKLSAPSVSVNPFDTIKAPANPKQLHPWTDLQGSGGSNPKPWLRKEDFTGKICKLGCSIFG